MAIDENTAQSLTDLERNACLAGIEQDSYVILPVSLPTAMIDRANAYIDAYCAKVDEAVRAEQELSETNIVELDPVFREFLLYKPALQLSYDVFGPMFHLEQDKWTRKYRALDNRDPIAINWHSDGPLGFPEVEGRCPLHTLRFGYFLSTATHDDSGTLEVIRSSHRKKVLHAQDSIHFQPFKVIAGTISPPTTSPSKARLEPLSPSTTRSGTGRCRTSPLYRGRLSTSSIAPP